MKALCIGQSTYNFISLVDKMPTGGSETNISEVVECGGGSAANIAYLLGKYGVDSYLSSVVGDDTFGNLLKKELESVNVHTEYMETAYEKRTALTFSLISKEDKSRMQNNISKDKLLLKKSDYQLDPDIIYTDAFDYGASLAALNKFANKITIIGAKSCTQEVLELCKYCKYIIASKEFAEWVSGTKIDFNNPGSLVTVYSTLLSKFVKKEIIITLGNQGALYIANNQIKVMPGLKENIEDTTGSGDFFRGAYAYALLQEFDTEKAVTFANIAGGLSSTKIGTREAVPDLSDIMTHFNQKYSTPAPTPETPSVANNQTSTVNSQVQSNQSVQTPASSSQASPTTNVTPEPAVENVNTQQQQVQLQPIESLDNASNQ